MERKITFRLPEKEYNMIKDYAMESNYTISKALRTIINIWWYKYEEREENEFNFLTK